MTSAIVLPNLTNWAKNHINAIYQTTSQTDFTGSIDAFLSDKVDITVNGVKTSRSDFINQISAQKSLEAGAAVNYLGTVEVPSNADQPISAGSVGLFFNVTIGEEIIVLGAPLSKTVTTSLNIVVIQDPDVPKPPPSPIRGDFDGRRVVALNAVTLLVPPSTAVAPSS